MRQITMYPILHWLRRFVPRPIFDLYHRSLSWIAAVWYGHPSRRLVVIGVTGTSGKTTTCYLISKILEANGAKTGCLTTALFKIADTEWENRTKMTMLGRFQTQKLLRQMVDAGCAYAVIETTSQGIVQHRHEHVAYDVVVLTNLWSEHIEAHGGFEAYKQAKRRLFEYAAWLPPKKIDGRVVVRAEVLNAANEHAKDFVVKAFSDVQWFSDATTRSEVDRDDALFADHVHLSPDHSEFQVQGLKVRLRLPGAVNVANAVAALAVAQVVGLPLTDAIQGLSAVSGLPGRYERIEEGQPFVVMVDYAFEPGAMNKLYELVKVLPHGRIIHVLGSAGGGRDISRRAVLGEIAGKNADLVIVTNEDPYDDDPRQIIEQVANGAQGAGRKVGEDLLLIDDRREAIQEAIRRAQPGDTVLITGKGSEPVMAVANGQKIPWDDRQEARQAIRKMRVG